MKSTKLSLLALFVFFIGWFLTWVGYGDTVPAPYNTVMYISGLLLFFAGLFGTIYLVFKRP